MLASLVDRLRVALRSRRFWLYVVVTIAAIAVGVGIALASGGGDSKKSSSPVATPLPVAEHATARANGITTEVSSAWFSGTETVLALAVILQTADATHLRQVTLTSDELDYSWRDANASKAPHASPAMAIAGVRTQIEAVPRNHDTGPWSFVLHLGPVIGPGKYAVTVSRIEITLDSGASRTVTGPWTSALSVPTNVTSSLATQTLKPAQPANADGIVVTVEDAVRSDSETLVEIRSKGVFGAIFLAPPTLTASGKVYTGRLLPFSGGSTMIYDFPAIPRGVVATMTLRNAAVSVPGVASYFADVDVGSAMVRAGLSAKPGDRVSLSADGVVADPGGPIASDIEFKTGDIAVVTLAKPLLLGQTGIAGPVEMTLPDGSTVNAEGLSTSAANRPAEGVSKLTFHVAAAQLDGIVRLSLGAPPTVDSGPWTVHLSP